MKESTKYVMDKIAQSLLYLMKRTPIGSISICAIINEAEVSRNSFYRHFQDKDDILSSIISKNSQPYFSYSPM